MGTKRLVLSALSATALAGARGIEGARHKAGYVDALRDVISTLDKGKRKWEAIWPSNRATKG